MKNPNKEDSDEWLHYEFYSEYVKLGGDKDGGCYQYFRKIMEAMIGDSHISGLIHHIPNEDNGIHITSGYSFNQWINFVGDLEEAERIFRSIDNVTAYS